MINVRRIWHFKLQSSLHREMLNPSITKKFAIAILKVELHCSSIVKKNIYILFSPDANFLSPLFRPKHHPPPNINITHHSDSFFLVGCDPADSVVAFFILFFWHG